MFLRAVRLQHWACHETLELTPGPGLNVVVGPNGVGKSTLCGAIVAALTVKYSSKDREVRLLEPWGTEGCGPSVRLDLTRPDGDWRLSKTYLNDALARLERFEGDRWTLRHKGRAAEEELARWLDADGAAGRLLVELWSPQADPTRLFEAATRGGKLAPASLIGPGLVERVESSEPKGPFSLAKRQVTEHVARSFTPVNRQVRVGSELHQAGLALLSAEARWDELARRRDELALGVEEYRRREAIDRDDRGERERLSVRGAERKRSREAYLRRFEAVREAESDARTCREAFERFDLAHRRLLKAAGELTTAEGRLVDLEPQVLSRRAARQTAEEELRGAERRRAEVVSRLDRLGAALDRLNRLSDAQRAHDERLAAERSAARRLSIAEAARDEAEVAAADARENLHRAEAAHRAAHCRMLAIAVRKAEVEAESARDRLGRADYAILRAEHDQLERTVRLATDRLDELATLDPSADGGPVPSVAIIDELRNRAAGIEARRAALESDALSLRFEPDAPVAARIRADEQGDDEPPAMIAAGEAVEARAIGRIVLEIEGIGRVEVARTSTDPEQRRRQVEADCREVADRLLALGAGSVADLERRLDRAARRSALEAELAGLLGGDSIEVLRRRLADRAKALLAHGDPPPRPEAGGSDPPIERLRAAAGAANEALALARDRLAAVAHDAGAGTGLDPAEAALRVCSARDVLTKAERTSAESAREVDEARHRLADARGRLGDAEQLLADEGGTASDAGDLLEFEISSLRHELIVWDADPPGETGQAVRLRRQEVENDLAEKRRRRDDEASGLNQLDIAFAKAEAERNAALQRIDELRAEAPDDGPSEAGEQRLEDLRREWDRAEAQANVLRDQLGPDPAADDDDFESRREEIERRCQQGEHELDVCRLKLEWLGGDGLDSKLAIAAEQLDDCRSRHESLVRDANAWRLLDRVLGEVETDFARDVARQVERLASRWVDRLTGRNVRSVTLDPDSLSPIAAQAEVTDLARALEYFSRGTREQVALACRLQLGVLLAQDGRQMILLDDPLAHTDPDRHGEALEVLSEVARSLQVLIFTCHRDRYTSLWERGDARLLGLDRRDDHDDRPGLSLAAGLGA